VNFGKTFIRSYKSMKVARVITKADLLRFLKLPYQLYKDDPVWVPPLLDEQRSQFNAKRNPTLDHCKYALFLLEEEGRPVGRIAAFIDLLALETWKEPIGLFGYYECIENDAASQMLLDAASGWLRENNMKVMRGPWSFVSQEWGLVIEGFTPSPTVMAPYNPPFYADHMTGYNLQKIKDLLVYYISVAEGYRIPERIMTHTDNVARRYSVNVRPVDMKHYDEEVKKVIDLSNRSLINNWGYTAVTKAEAEAIGRDLKPIIQPKGVLFAEGNTIGFAIALPNVNVLLKGLNGRLFPFGWLTLLRGLPKLTSYRLFALGVVPEYQGKGIDSLIYRALCESLNTPDTWMEINYVLEDNHPMNNAICKLDAKPLRRYRIYQKEIYG
jgi:GNAT superfamily N-acetyltransferase